MNLPTNTWCNLILVTPDVTNDSSSVMYVNGTPLSIIQQGGSVVTHTLFSGTRFLIGDFNRFSLYFNGLIDDVRFYNRALSTAQVAASYVMGPLPEVGFFANYYSYTEPVTNNTMLICVNSANASDSNFAFVTCVNFFVANWLSFRANNSVTINVWTSLGEPAFSNGVWNSQNYTTTLTISGPSTAELNWNRYKIATYADAYSIVSPSNPTVDYGGSQTFNFSVTQGYSFNVAVDGVNRGQISNWTFNNVTAQHVVHITSTPMQPFPLEVVAVAVGVLIIIVIVFSLGFKKGYITIEIVEENLED